MKTQTFRHNDLNLAHKIKLFGLTALATAGITLLNIEPILAQTVFATKQILSFEMQQGLPQWEQSIMQRVAGARWAFYPNGTFVYAPVNSREDLYPLEGIYQNQDNTISFICEKSSSIGSTGAARVTINGTIQFNSGQPVLQMQSVTTMSSAVNINEGVTSYSAYQITVILNRLQ